MGENAVGWWETPRAVFTVSGGSLQRGEPSLSLRLAWASWWGRVRLGP